MLNLVWLRSFVTLVHCKGFQTAGEALGIAQPTVSQHIQKLEMQLGVCLFQRNRVGCQPTREALALLPIAQSMLTLNQRAQEAVKSAPLRVGASSNIGIYMLNPQLKTFLDDTGAVGVDLVIDRNPAIAEKLVNGELDIALMEWWQPQPGFQWQQWKQEPLVLIVPPEHPYAALGVIGQEQLLELELLGGESGTGTGRLLKRYFGADAKLPRVSMQLGSTEAVKQAVKAGLGISLVLASSVIEEVRNASLRAIPVADPGLAKALFVIWPETSARHRPVPAFVRHLCSPEVLLTGAAADRLTDSRSH
jgi:DNA-binding transcriptional LysR family regulator